MTDVQKEQIIALRKEGLSYGEIAYKLDLRTNTVKSYCRRKFNGRSKTKSAEPKPIVASVDYCQECGKPIRQIQGRKTRRFCSDSCRMKWWNAHPKMVKRKNPHEQFCPHCGKKFFVYGNQSRKYCSHDCYIEDRFGGKHEQG